jgi:hypothetical protein
LFIIALMAPLAALNATDTAIKMDGVDVVARDVLMPAVPGSVHLGGRLGDKLDLCVTNRILAQDLETVVAPFRAKKETKEWRSEFWGKWFTSLALADAYHSTPETREKCDEAVKGSIGTVAPAGYIGTHAPEHRLEGWKG